MNEMIEQSLTLETQRTQREDKERSWLSNKQILPLWVFSASRGSLCLKNIWTTNRTNHYWDLSY